MFLGNRSYSINISIPSQNESKRLTVSEHERIHSIKKKIIKNISTPEEDTFTNNGLLLVSKKKDIKQFLNDKDEIGDLYRYASDVSLEFVPKFKIPKKEDQINSSSTSICSSENQKKLMDSIRESNEEQIKSLLEMGIDPNFIDENKETPVSLCISKGKIELLNLLLDNGACIDYKIPRGGKNWITYLQHAILCLSFSCFKLLLDRGIWMEDTDKLNRTAIYYAIKVDSVDFVDFLLKSGANIQCVDAKGFLPIHYACKKGNAKIVQYLIDYGSDLNFVDSNGNTPIHIAMKYNHKESVRWLLIRGSRKDLPNNEGQRPVDINRSNKCDEETIKMVETFNCNDIIPPPPKFSLLTEGKQKDKKKQRKTIVVKVPPPPPFLPSKAMADNNLDGYQRSRSTSIPAVLANSRQFFKGSGSGINKNIYCTVTGRPTLEPNNRFLLRSNNQLHFNPIYDSSVYTSNNMNASGSITSTPLSNSIELDIDETPQTAVNPEDEVTTPSIDTPRTAINKSFTNIRMGGGGSSNYGSTGQLSSNLDSRSSSMNGLTVDNSSMPASNLRNSGIYSNVFNNINLNTAGSCSISNSVHSSTNALYVSNKSVDSSQRSSYEQGIKDKEENFDTKTPTPTSSNPNLHKAQGSGGGEESPSHKPSRIEMLRGKLKNLDLSNTHNIGNSAIDSPRSAIYVPTITGRSKKGRCGLKKNQDFSSASSLLSAFIKNDITSALDNILNIDNESDDSADDSEENSNDNGNLDVTQYKFSPENDTEDNPNYDLIRKAFNTDLLTYIQGLKLATEGEGEGEGESKSGGGDGTPVVQKKARDEGKGKNPTRKDLVIEEEAYQNAQLNNKEVLLETYEKLFLILEDIQLRSTKAKITIDRIKEEHNNLIEEIKMIRDKENESKSRNGSRLVMSSINEINEDKN